MEHLPAPIFSRQISSILALVIGAALNCINYARPITIATNQRSYDGELCPSSSTPIDAILASITYYSEWNELISTACARVILFNSDKLSVLSEIHLSYQAK
ncbi:hypothetical protein PV325_003199 [Microctonus aethiopoides]|uniref:Uncharacterized protein n=1 Tax=Microctonus aethiopoides TaxID=144406 RepID=A0AA39C9E1_9HYME|nr:hypothetical protein PV325_003199 [Microctonus aethiopoides]KAK0091508.1 hypothetical protein PV326_003104 [Microctonus aethiopoides]KAK0160268.1 hypothetical protein PV328_007696 [Microctonus aethiopoides]